MIKDTIIFPQTIYRSLRSLLEHDGNVEDDLMVTFCVEYQDIFGDSHKHELKEKAENINVTNENRQVKG